MCWDLKTDKCGGVQEGSFRFLGRGCSSVGVSYGILGRAALSVDVLGILGEVNQTPNQPQAEVSWARLFMCVDVLGILGEVSQT